MISTNDNMEAEEPRDWSDVRRDITANYLFLLLAVYWFFFVLYVSGIIIR